MSEAARVVIAQVMDAHGVKGQIKLRPLTDFPERFLSMEELSFYRRGSFVGTYEIAGVREVPAQGCLFVNLAGILNRDQAETFKGCTVEISQEERVPLNDGEFWVSDLIGLNVQDDQGKDLGSIRNVLDTGASDLLDIVDLDGKSHLVPLVEEFLVSVDLEKRLLVIRLIDGLWSL